MVTLPALRADVVEPAAIVRPSVVAASAHARHVLVVDDNVDAAAVPAEFLRDAGHDVVMAHDGVEALRAVESFVPDVAIVKPVAPEVLLQYVDG